LCSCSYSRSSSTFGPSPITIPARARIRTGWVTEWLIVHAWKACVPKGTGGSNPPPSVALVKCQREIKSITVLHSNSAEIRPCLPMSHNAGNGAQLGRGTRQRFRIGLHARGSCTKKDASESAGLRSLPYPRQIVTARGKPRLTAPCQSNSSHEDPSGLAGKGQGHRPRTRSAWLVAQLESRNC
jgi:hypothetical protein